MANPDLALDAALKKSFLEIRNEIRRHEPIKMKNGSVRTGINITHEDNKQGTMLPPILQEELLERTRSMLTNPGSMPEWPVPVRNEAIKRLQRFTEIRSALHQKDIVAEKFAQTLPDADKWMVPYVQAIEADMDRVHAAEVQRLKEKQNVKAPEPKRSNQKRTPNTGATLDGFIIGPDGEPLAPPDGPPAESLRKFDELLRQYDGTRPKVADQSSVPKWESMEAETPTRISQGETVDGITAPTVPNKGNLIRR